MIHNGEVGQLWNDIGISAMGALAVVISAMIMYAVFAVVLYLWGDYLREKRTTLAAALAALLGAIAARATLGNHPTLTGGLIALTTLLVLERLFGALIRATRNLPRGRGKGHQ